MKPVTRLVCIGVAFCVGSGWAYESNAQDQTPAVATSTATAPVADQTLAAAAPQVATVEGFGSPVGADQLDQTRGGFDLPSGLAVSFGIERAVYVNGNLVTQTSFYVPNVAQMTTAQATAMAAANTTTLVQLGQGNTVDPSILNQGVGATVIQNTLNGQHLQNITTINTAVNSLNAFRSMNELDTLQSALQTLGR